jgi:hypothetical protein
MKKVFLGIITLVSFSIYSQNYFVTIGKDSIVCRQINFFDTNAQGKMIDLEYVNNDNEIIRLKKNDIPEIKTLCQDGVVYLRMPLNIKKTDGLLPIWKTNGSWQNNCRCL